MSLQKGNVKRTRGQKYQNKRVFKNDLHDTSKRTKNINSMEIAEVCKQCKDIIEWKVKYKKYKPLSQPKTCLNCHMKNIKFAYHVLCKPCGKLLNICCKCRESKEKVEPSSAVKSKEEILAEMEGELKLLPERKRRTFLRYMDKLYDKKKKKKKKSSQTNKEKEVKADADTEEPVKENENEEEEFNLEDYVENVRKKLEQLGKDVLMGIDDDELDFSDSDEYDGVSDE